MASRSDAAQLSKYSYLNEFEKQTNVSKVYVVLGLAAVYFFLIFFNVAAEFLVNTIGFVIPAYYSLHALFTAGTADDTQWLTVRCLCLVRRPLTIPSTGSPLPS